MKEGHCLIVEEADEYSYSLLKNIIKDLKVYDKGKLCYVIDYIPREVDSKFRLIFLKDKIDSKINNKGWIENKIINFNPSREQIKNQLLNDILIKEDFVLHTTYSKVPDDTQRDLFKILEIEDKLLTIYSQFDFSGNPEKNGYNQGLIEKMKNEIGSHTVVSERLSGYTLRKAEFEEEIMKFDSFANDGANIWKIISKFIYLDNVYNFSYTVFSKILFEFYKNVIKVKEIEYKNSKENLLLLIHFIIDRIIFLFSMEDRKIFLFLLICYYLSEKSMNIILIILFIINFLLNIL